MSPIHDNHCSHLSAETEEYPRSPLHPPRLSVLILPNELLSLIIELHVQGTHSRRGRPLMTIAHVCHLFRTIALRFVNHLSLQNLDHLVTKHIASSSPNLRALSLTLGLNDYPVFTHLSPHRICLPLARSLEIKRGAIPPNIGWFIPFFPSHLHLPSLESLTLFNLGISPNILRSFSHLTHLALIVRPDINVTFPGPLQMHPVIVLGVLHFLPWLEDLELDGSICSTAPPSLIKPIVNLRRLRSLHLANHGRKQLDVLDGLNFPLGTRITLCFRSLFHPSHLRQVGDVIIRKLGMDSDTWSELFRMFALRSTADEHPTVRLQWHREMISLIDVLFDRADPGVQIQIPLPERQWVDHLFNGILKQLNYSGITKLYLGALPHFNTLLPSQLCPLLSSVYRLEIIILSSLNLGGSRVGELTLKYLDKALHARKACGEALDKLVLWNCIHETAHVHRGLSSLAREFHSFYEVE